MKPIKIKLTEKEKQRIIELIIQIYHIVSMMEIFIKQEVFKKEYQLGYHSDTNG